MGNDLDAEWAKVLACALYPIIIVVFKVVQKVTLIAAAPQLEPAVEFGSLALAALPYRVVFLGLGNWVTFGVATVLFYLREERDVSPVAKSVLSDAKFMRLLTQYGASFGFEVVFVGLALLVSRSLFDAVHFRPLTHARKPLNAYILILGLFYCVVYTGTFVVVDVENVPISA